MDEPSFEEQYEDVLQNIESQIIAVYREDKTLTDYDVDRALELLAKNYVNESRGKEPILPRNRLSEYVYVRVKSMCDWRLGRPQMQDDDGEPVDLPLRVLQMDEILACLKRLRKSIATWNKQGGRQGYLMYINQFL